MKIDDTIAFIQSNGSELAKSFNAISIKYASQMDDLSIEGWIEESIFKSHPNIQKLVIPARLGHDDSDYIGLRIGLHIRLTEKFGEKRFIPLIFLSERNKESLLFNQVSANKEKTATLLNTPNCKVVPIDEDAIKEALSNFKKPLDDTRFKLEGLPKLIIETQRDRGHQLANEWGCIRLAKLASLNLTQSISSDLYFKYRLASLLSEVDLDPIIPNSLLNQDINVLLIDDNAKNGWEEIIQKFLQKYIVSPNNKVQITSIESVSDFHNAKSDIEKYDVLFLDLRLSKDEDNPSRAIKIEDFTGSKVLKEIKAINRGIQTVILTASNKAWNMKYLLDLGADGYYIKESPEIIVTNDFSKESITNFIGSIKKSISRQYLKAFFNSHNAMISRINNLIALPSITIDFKDLLEEIRSHIESSFEMIYTASNESDEEKTKTKFGYAYISLFRVVEKMNDYYKNSGLTVFPNYYFNENDLINNPISAQVYQIGSNVNKLNEFGALAWVSIDKINLTTNDFIQSIFWAVKRRNKFIHADSTMSGELKTECDKIYNYEGYKELLEVLEKIICNSNFV
jgi:CheY-like chemotaxis protein